MDDEIVSGMLAFRPLHIGDSVLDDRMVFVREPKVSDGVLVYYGVNLDDGCVDPVLNKGSCGGADAKSTAVRSQ